MNPSPDSLAEFQPLSVVIATLGGDVLVRTLAQLNASDAPPAEILVCIPEEEARSRSDLSRGNVRLVAVPFRGQVAQRAFGLAQATQPYVMQLDDDIIISPASIREMMDALMCLGPGTVVAPFFRHLETGAYITRFSGGLKGWLNDVYLSVLCGAPWGRQRMGKLTAAGIGYWIDRTLVGDSPFETEWLPGGCAMCRREDLVTESYFPFPGKAFSEDLIHSILWRRQGARLWAVPTADCSTEIDPLPFEWRLMSADLRAHAYVVSMIRGSYWRLYLWFAAFLVKQSVIAAVRALRAPGVPLSREG